MKLSPALLLLALPSLANANPLPSRTYTFKTGGKDFTCYQGVASNGHNYPVPTQIILNTSLGSSGIYYPSKFPMNNTQSVEFEDPAAKPCSAYPDLLGADDYALNGTAVQKFSETLGKGDTGECFRSVHEGLTITIGSYTFFGASEFIQPMDPSDCP